MDNNNQNSNTTEKTIGAATIIVVGIFTVCVIFILAKVIFTSNSAEVPKGIDTATINTDEPSSVMDIIYDSESDSDSSDFTESSMADFSSQVQENIDDSSQSEYLAVMYVTEYAYLHTAPDNEAENIVCMSPGVEVNVLEYEDNGYVKITFVNIDGPLTGYIYKDYLAYYDYSDNAQQTTTWQSDDYYTDYNTEYSTDYNNYGY